MTETTVQIPDKVMAAARDLALATHPRAKPESKAVESLTLTIVELEILRGGLEDGWAEMAKYFTINARNTRESDAAIAAGLGAKEVDHVG